MTLPRLIRVGPCLVRRSSVYINRGPGLPRERRSFISREIHTVLFAVLLAHAPVPTRAGEGFRRAAGSSPLGPGRCDSRRSGRTVFGNDSTTCRPASGRVPVAPEPHRRSVLSDLSVCPAGGSEVASHWGSDLRFPGGARSGTCRRTSSPGTSCSHPRPAPRPSFFMDMQESSV